MKVADSLYTSKIRYGIQLLGKVRTNDKDPINTQVKKIQVAQNKFARFMAGISLLDKINYYYYYYYYYLEKATKPSQLINNAIRTYYYYSVSFYISIK